MLSFSFTAQLSSLAEISEAQNALEFLASAVYVEELFSGLLTKSLADSERMAEALLNAERQKKAGDISDSRRKELASQELEKIPLYAKIKEFAKCF
jgi:hypothetical protein